MKVVNQYIIPFKSLKEDDHNFDFEIGEKFFEEFESLGIRTGKVVADVLLKRRSSFLELQISLKGSLELQCDRCLEYFTFPLDFTNDLFVKFKEEPDEPDDSIIFIHPNEDTLDLTQYFIDSIGLSVPIQKIHPDNNDGSEGCDKEMLAILRKNSKNTESTDGEVIDPRWAQLKDLLNEGNKN